MEQEGLGSAKFVLVVRAYGCSYLLVHLEIYVQSTLVISKSKAPSETLRDIRTSTYQICRIEKKNNQTTKGLGSIRGVFGPMSKISFTLSNYSFVIWDKNYRRYFVI